MVEMQYKDPSRLEPTVDNLRSKRRGANFSLRTYSSQSRQVFNPLLPDGWGPMDDGPPNLPDGWGPMDDGPQIPFVVPTWLYSS